MPQILRDPIWQFVGALVTCTCGAITILLPILLFILQRRKKSISYEILADTALIAVGDEIIRGKLRILFEEKPVQKVSLVLFRISNAGNLPIVPSDFEKPLSFHFGKESRILSTEVTAVKPKALKPQLRVQQSQIVIEPLLLNGGDSITIKAIVDQHTGWLDADARITGVSKIEESIALLPPPPYLRLLVSR
jgi:hypothetical protein